MSATLLLGIGRTQAAIHIGSLLSLAVWSRYIVSQIYLNIFISIWCFFAETLPLAMYTVYRRRCFMVWEIFQNCKFLADVMEIWGVKKPPLSMFLRFIMAPFQNGKSRLGEGARGKLFTAINNQSLNTYFLLVQGYCNVWFTKVIALLKNISSLQCLKR